MGFISELRRRNVLRGAIAYGVFGWIVIQVIDIVGPELALPDSALRVTLVTLAVCFPFVLIFAWMFRWTPDGLVRHSGDESHHINFSAHWLNATIVSLLSIALILVVLDAYVLENDESQGLDSIAVLPFANLSGNEGQDYFSDGLSEELLNLLAKIEGLKVAARTSSFAFKDQNQDIREIGRDLGVATVLEGSVRQSGDRIRVTAQLINVADGYHLWSNNFDRELNDIFEIQDEIATNIVSALRLHLDTGETPVVVSARQINVDAYNKYLQGLEKEKTGDIRDALDLYREATQLDADFSKAWAGRARIVILLRKQIYGGEIPRDEAELLATTAINKALSIDPELPEALIAHAIYLTDNFRYEEAMDSLNRALQINPNSIDALTWLADLQYRTGYQREAEKNLLTALSLDPKNRGIIFTAFNVASNTHSRTLFDRVLLLADESDRKFLSSRWDFDNNEVTAERYRQYLQDEELSNFWGLLKLAATGELHKDLIGRLSNYPRDVYMWNLMHIAHYEEAVSVYNSLPVDRQKATVNLEEMSVMYAAEGNCETSLQYLQQAHGDAVPIYGVIGVNARRSNTNLALNRAHCLRKLGRESEAAEVLAKVRVHVDTLRENADCCYSVVDAKLRLLNGDTDGALDVLAASKHRMDPELRFSPVIKDLVGNPRFDDLMAEANDRRNATRAELGLPPITEVIVIRN